MRSSLFLAILACASVANATVTTRPKNVGNQQILEVQQSSSTNKLDLIQAAATNGAPSVTIPLDAAWEKLRVLTFVTYAANVYVTVAVTCSLDNTNFAAVQSRSIAAGVATLSDLSDKKTLSAADQDFMTEYDVRGCMSVKITLGGDSTDVASLQAVAVR